MAAPPFSGSLKLIEHHFKNVLPIVQHISAGFDGTCTALVRGGEAFMAERGFISSIESFTQPDGPTTIMVHLHCSGGLLGAELVVPQHSTG